MPHNTLTPPDSAVNSAVAHLSPREAAEALVFTAIALIIEKGEAIPDGPVMKFAAAISERAVVATDLLPDNAEGTDEQEEQKVVDLALRALQFTSSDPSALAARLRSAGGYLTHSQSYDVAEILLGLRSHE